MATVDDKKIIFSMVGAEQDHSAEQQAGAEEHPPFVLLWCKDGIIGLNGPVNLPC